MSNQEPNQPVKDADKRRNARQMNESYSLYGAGIEFVVAMLLPGAAGYWLDGKCGTRPWLMLIGGCLGFAAGLLSLIRAVKEFNK